MWTWRKRAVFYHWMKCDLLGPCITETALVNSVLTLMIYNRIFISSWAKLLSFFITREDPGRTEMILYQCDLKVDTIGYVDIWDYTVFVVGCFNLSVALDPIEKFLEVATVRSWDSVILPFSLLHFAFVGSRLSKVIQLAGLLYRQSERNVECEYFSLSFSEISCVWEMFWYRH